MNGAEDEPFVLALGRALGNEVRGGTIEIRSTDGDGRLLAAVGVDREATMGVVGRFAGGETLQVSTIGRGGSRFVKLSEIVAAGLGLPDLVWVAALRDRDSADLLRRQNYEYVDRKQWGWRERPEA